MFEVFISYVHRDLKIAERIGDALKARNLSVYLDEDKLVAGNEFSPDIEEKLRNAKAAVLILSRHSKRSKWVDSETIEILRHVGVIVPFLLDEEAKNNWVWPLVSNRLAVTINPQTDFDELAQQIEDGVKKEAQAEDGVEKEASISVEVAEDSEEESATTWSEFIGICGAVGLNQKIQLPAAFTSTWAPTPDDARAAWDLYTELRTRITVQPLHYLHGDEEGALSSVADLFKTSRELIHKYKSNARQFATLTVFVLNRVVRPFTAQWHKRKLAGELNNEDTRHEFRSKLSELQPLLRQFATMLGHIAEGSAFEKNSESWPVEADQSELAEHEPEEENTSQDEVLTENIPFDIVFDEMVPQAVVGEIRQAEKQAILARRGQAESNRPLTDVAGLAISGGGIRSSTFALGVVQRLVSAGVMPHFDYLSTVSGGGYLGSFLSTYLNSSDQNNVGLAPKQLPFAKPAVGESTPLRHLRGHSNYLFTGGLLNRLNMILLAVHGVLANALMFWPLLGAILLLVARLQGSVIKDLVDQDTIHPGKVFSLSSYLWNSTTQQFAFGSILAALLSLAPVGRCFRWLRKDDWLPRFQAFVSFVLIGGILVTLWNLIPPLLRLISLPVKDGDLKINWQTLMNNTTYISGALVVAQRLWASLDRAPAASKLRRFVSMAILGLMGPLFVITLFVSLGEEMLVKHPKFWIGPSEHVGLTSPLVLLTVIPLAYVLLFMDVNLSSLHPFYRRKLSQAFLIEHTNDPAKIRPNDGMRLSEMRLHNAHAPYHLINCALNAQDSDNRALRGRGTGFFLFSQLYSGSAVTGYQKTTKWEDEDAHLNLGTAMAISAGAAAPFMGVVSVPSANFILSLFNIRLDYWLAVPGRPHMPFAGPHWLLRQAFGWLNESTSFVNVSDGGHIENLGLYELIRRRCRFIVAIDGECDPNLTCGSLMQLTRFVKIDFGVDVKVDMTRFKKNADGTSPFHFSLGTIKYPSLDAGSPSAEGQLLYIKLSRTGNEPAGVNYYRLKNADFPHQSTADQFFDEDQFEAYRALGEHAANDLFSPEILGTQTNPATLKGWFGKIYDALHDPNNE